MSFINPIAFKAALPKATLLDFIARTPADQFVFVAPAGPYIYGLFLTEDVAEFLCNEFLFDHFEIVPAADLRTLARDGAVKIWGNRELLEV
ncbi:hypothetical protein [Flaviaesturariibacter amylovorans]|uniref:Uncharacterized protein n=1 Tax=Flaviaesturariibacter amylovorans TaxID=1084520 RepID=A0ABP8HA22_9BACT